MLLLLFVKNGLPFIKHKMVKTGHNDQYACCMAQNNYDLKTLQTKTGIYSSQVCELNNVEKGPDEVKIQHLSQLA